MNNVVIKVADTESLYQECVNIRFKVFVEEQNVPEEIEVDANEGVSTHFLLVDGDDESQPLGTVRYRPLDDHMVKVERMAVMKEARGHGYGYDLMNAVHEHAATAGYQAAKLGAQVQAIPFYEKLGYVVDSDVFDDAGIPHKYMVRDL
jgi:predicted GNAT family N-acyltransferase